MDRMYSQVVVDGSVASVIHQTIAMFLIAANLFRLLVSTDELGTTSIPFRRRIPNMKKITVGDVILNNNDIFCAVFRAVQVALEFKNLSITVQSCEQDLTVLLQEASTDGTSYVRTAPFDLFDSRLFTVTQRRIATADCTCLLFALVKPLRYEYNVFVRLNDSIRYFRKYLREEDKNLDFEFCKFTYCHGSGMIPVLSPNAWNAPDPYESDDY